MSFARASIFALVAASMVSACAGGPRQPRIPDNVIRKALSGAPGAAQPSDIVSNEIAMARAAKQGGLRAALAQYALPDAVLHGVDGPVALVSLAQLPAGPDSAVQWSPRMVVQSCDGALALSHGRFVDDAGMVGNYVTTWVRQGDESFKLSYDVAGRDNPQPPPRAPSQPGDIVVTALDAVQGLVASCPRGGEAVPPPPPLAIAARGEAQISADGTLRWAWEHGADGSKAVFADYYFEGEWRRAFEERWSPAR